MTDIMARLRRVRNDAEGYAIDVDIDLLFKAAREIERLRAALQPDILADNDVRKTAPALEKRADILPDTAAAVANERAAILELIDSERDRVPKTGEY